VQSDSRKDSRLCLKTRRQHSVVAQQQQLTTVNVEAGLLGVDAVANIEASHEALLGTAVNLHSRSSVTPPFQQPACCEFFLGSPSS
jgi:hypothetical protein